MNLNRILYHPVSSDQANGLSSPASLEGKVPMTKKEDLTYIRPHNHGLGDGGHGIFDDHEYHAPSYRESPLAD
jgi:hypothetical protein